MRKTTRISIVEDDPLVSERFQAIIAGNPQLSVGFTCSSLQTGMEYLVQNPTDVLLLDIGLPDGNGIDLIHFIHDKNLPTQVIVITIFSDDKHIMDAISAGAMGYLLKDEEHQAIDTSIMQMLAGGSPISPSIARHLLKRFQPNNTPSLPTNNDTSTRKSHLTKRETEILQEISKGFTCKEISEMESLSYHTITTHVRNIYKKLAVNSRAEALFEAYNMGLL